MVTARQVLRWAIPGWLLFLFAYLFVISRFILSGKVLTLTAFAFNNYASLLSLTTIAAGVGIPVGFLLYQIYYWMYWRVPLPFKTPRDRGYDILKDVAISWNDWVGYDLDMDAHLLEGKVIFSLGSFVIRIRTRELLKRYQHNWVLAENVWDILLWHHKARWLDVRAEMLGDIYHSLGTSVISLTLGYIGYLVYDLLMHRALILAGDYSYLYGAAFNMLLVFVLLTILRFTRSDTLRSLVAYKHDLIVYLFSRTPYEPDDETLDHLE